MKPCFLLLTAILCSCSTPSVTVRTLFSSVQQLPSVKMDTPDPTKPLRGREHILSIQWNSPDKPSPELKLIFRFADRVFVEKKVSLVGTSGSLNYEIDQALFREHGSLVSYRISLTHDQEELAFSEHKLWVPAISVE